MNRQLSLFSTETMGLAGLRYYPEIITQSMEFDVIERIRGLSLVPFRFGAYEGKRRVASFGFKYDYAERRLQEAGEVPEWLAPVIENSRSLWRPEREDKTNPLHGIRRRGRNRMAS